MLSRAAEHIGDGIKVRLVHPVVTADLLQLRLDLSELRLDRRGILPVGFCMNMTLYDVMLYSARNDMVAREWINGFALTRRGADLIHSYDGGCGAVVGSFIELLSTEPDTFIIKKHGQDTAWEVMKKAREVRDGIRDISRFDQECIDARINPGSIADIIIASLYIALGEGWAWD